MNKNILAIAIAAAVAAPSAFAAATVYGVAHMSYDSQDNGKDSVTGISSNSSRLGIKGSEDLGAGLKAVYQFETTILMDGDNSNAASLPAGNTNQGTGFGGQRNSFAGLAGGFGTVLLGIHDTPLKMMGRKFDFFGDQIGDTRTFTRAGSWDERPSNVLAYVSPSFNGLQATVAYVNDEQNKSANMVGWGNGDKRDALSASIDYKVGKFMASAAYENHDKGWGGATGKSMDAYRLGAGYDFGMVNVKGMFASQDVASGTAVKTRDIYGVGAGVKVGAAGTVKAQYYVANEVNKDNAGADLIAVGYDHAMSKNTTAYVAYSKVNNDKAGTFTTQGGGGHGENIAVAAPGKDPSAFSVGLIHKF